ncbi:MAG TPA: hypothetical protein VG650_13695 [Mycobacteriales bacterium]|nr:hypothetical protein [Mycobacteriales bacterium]
MDDWSPIERRDPFSGVPSYGDVSRPSIAGRDALAYAMADLVPKKKDVKKRWWQRWPKWLTWKRLVALLVLDLVLGHYAWNYIFAASPGAARGAVDRTLTDLSHHDWNGVYNSLCRDDRAQIDESDLAAAGTAALAQFGLGLARWTESSTRTVHQSLGPVNLPAVQVSGQVFPVTGGPSSYTVVAVHELSGWHVCMSAGGFSMFGYTEPLGSGFTP